MPAHGCGLCLLGNLLDHPKEKVGVRLFDLEPFQLGGDLTTVVRGVIDDVALSEAFPDTVANDHSTSPRNKVPAETESNLFT
jgi:hypothetical protein